MGLEVCECQARCEKTKHDSYSNMDGENNVPDHTPGEESMPADAKLADEMIGCKPTNPTLCIPLTALAAPSLPRLHKLSVRKRVITLVLVIQECDPLIVVAAFEQ